MTRTKSIAAVFTAVMLVLAGCSGAVSPGASGTDAGADDTSGDSAMDGSAGTGTVTLYVSDQPGAMSDFEHVNVTIDAVAYHQAEAAGDAATDANESGAEDEAEAEDEDEAEAEAEGEAEAESESEAEANATATNATAEDETESEEEREESEMEEDDDEEGEDGPWKRYEVNKTTVDLTELKGANATAVGQQRLPNGTYDKVHLYVSDVNATLKNGESANVKLPSGKLQLTEEFTVGNNESVDFVYDATVVKAGKSGKYILKPVVSESGTDVEIKEVARGEGEGSLGARFVGPVERGEAATVKVTQQGKAVAGATVEIDDQEYQTAGDGTVTFDVPADSEEVEVEVEYEDSEVELKRKFGVEVEADAGIEVRVTGEADTEGEAEADDDEEAEDADEESDDESDAEADGESETDAEADGESETDAEVDGESETDAGDNGSMDAESEADADATASADADSETDADATA